MCHFLYVVVGFCNHVQGECNIFRLKSEVEKDYHGIIVAVNHDGCTASKINVLLPPVTDLCKKRGGRKE